MVVGEGGKLTQWLEVRGGGRRDISSKTGRERKQKPSIARERVWQGKLLGNTGAGRNAVSIEEEMVEGWVAGFWLNLKLDFEVECI